MVHGKRRRRVRKRTTRMGREGRLGLPSGRRRPRLFLVGLMLLLPLLPSLKRRFFFIIYEWYGVYREYGERQMEFGE